MTDSYEQPSHARPPVPNPVGQEGDAPWHTQVPTHMRQPGSSIREGSDSTAGGQGRADSDGTVAEVRPSAATDDSASVSFNLHGDAEIVAGRIGTLIKEIRKKDLLEGSFRWPRDILDAPFVQSPHWSQRWDEAHDPATGNLAAPVLVIVAPRAIGSTTFALRLLAEHATSATTLLKLDPDWRTPSPGRLPLEEDHGFQLDLKDPERDRFTSEFLDAMPEHAERLRACRSHLVLTVAQELWDDHHVPRGRGVHVIHFQAAPDALALVEAHLKALGHSALVSSLRTFTKACASLKGLSAVKAARAVQKIVAAWEEHQQQLSAATPDQALDAGRLSLEARVTAALTDWRHELDALFGEAPDVRSPNKRSLPVDDRCLLLALAVHQSAPMSQVAHAADRLLRSLGEAPVTHAQAPVPVLRDALAGRGTRRRIHDVHATVDGQDNVVFDRPAYGQAVLEYVWDNYEVLRDPVLAWLVETATASGDAKWRAVKALAHLTVRHGSSDYLNALGKSASTSPEVLAAVMEAAVRDEHIGPLAWDTLYRWAEQESYTEAVISLCRRVLHDPASAAAEKRAMVRLRRVAHTGTTDTTREAVLNAFDELAQQPSGAARLVTEVLGWQQKKTSARAGGLAFLALMTAPDESHPGEPWLVRSGSTAGVDVPSAVHDLLADPRSKAATILRLVDWIDSCTGDEVAYGHLRDTLLPALRRHDMLKAGMALMRKLEGVCTARGNNVAEDFYQHLVDPRLQPTFPLNDEHDSEAA